MDLFGACVSAASEEVLALGDDPLTLQEARDVAKSRLARYEKRGSRERLEFDHIIPVSEGGLNSARNMELRCESCNRSKRARI